MMTTLLNEEGEPYLIAAIDFDGTLAYLGEVSPQNAAAVQQLKEYGIRPLLATGRNHHHIGAFNHHQGFEDPTVTSDGARVHFPGSPDHLLSWALSQEISTAIIQEAVNQAVTCLCFCEEALCLTNYADWGLDMERHREVGVRFQTAHPGRAIQMGLRVFKTLSYSTDLERLEKLRDSILGRFGGQVACIRNTPKFLEFISKGVNKVWGLKIVTEQLGIKPSQVLAFGDGVNDIGMLTWAGCGLCMAHGHQLARAAAKMVAPEGPPETNFALAVAQLPTLLTTLH